MKTDTTMPASRACTLAAGVVVGGACAWAAFKNGFALAPDQLDGYVFGAAGLGVAVGSWFMPALASHAALEGERGRAWVLRGVWVLGTLFVLMNAVGYTALHRTDKVGGNTVKVEEYERASAQLKSAEADLEVAKQDKRWAKTSACTNATAEQSKVFCGQVAVIRSNISTAQYTLKQGRPGAVDAQAEAVAWPLMADPITVGKAMPIVWALIQELAMSGFIYAALRPRRRRDDEVAAEPAFEHYTIKVEAAPAVEAAPVDLSPLLVAAEEALQEVEAARFAFYQAMAYGALEAFQDDEEDVSTVTVAAPAVEEVQNVATPVAKAKRGQPKKTKQRKVRDASGRFAKKAKLVSVTAEPVKIKLADLPTLGGSANVVIFGGPKKD